MSDDLRPEILPVEIPAGQLSATALEGIVESYILREGTDYGVNEISYEAKVDRIRRQLERGDVKIIFDPESESVTMMTKHEWSKLSRVKTP